MEYITGVPADIGEIDREVSYLSPTSIWLIAIIARSEINSGLFRTLQIPLDSKRPEGYIFTAENRDCTHRMDETGVLLKNENNLLPLYGSGKIT